MNYEDIPQQHKKIQSHSGNEDSLVQTFQKLYQQEYGRKVSLAEAERILSGLADLLQLAASREPHDDDNPP